MFTLASVGVLVGRRVVGVTALPSTRPKMEEHDINLTSFLIDMSNLSEKITKICEVMPGGRKALESLVTICLILEELSRKKDKGAISAPWG